MLLNNVTAAAERVMNSPYYLLARAYITSRRAGSGRHGCNGSVTYQFERRRQRSVQRWLQRPPAIYLGRRRRAGGRLARAMGTSGFEHISISGVVPRCPPTTLYSVPSSLHYSRYVGHR